MYTAWHTPQSLTQLETDQVNYSDGAGVLDDPQLVHTVRPVVGNAQSNGTLVTQEANSLLFKQFGFAVNSAAVTQVQIRLTVARLSRIQDRTIQLYSNGLVGENLADVAAGDVHVYTAPAPLGVDYNTPDFGCVIDLAPHRLIPSNNSIIIRDVSMRLLLL